MSDAGIAAVSKRSSSTYTTDIALLFWRGGRGSGLSKLCAKPRVRHYPHPWRSQECGTTGSHRQTGGFGYRSDNRLRRLAPARGRQRIRVGRQSSSGERAGHGQRVPGNRGAARSRKRAAVFGGRHHASSRFLEKIHRSLAERLRPRSLRRVPRVDDERQAVVRALCLCAIEPSARAKAARERFLGKSSVCLEPQSAGSDRAAPFARSGGCARPRCAKGSGDYARDIWLDWPSSAEKVSGESAFGQKASFDIPGAWRSDSTAPAG